MSLYDLAMWQIVGASFAAGFLVRDLLVMAAVLVRRAIG